MISNLHVSYKTQYGITDYVMAIEQMVIEAGS